MILCFAVFSLLPQDGGASLVGTQLTVEFGNMSEVRGRASAFKKIGLSNGVRAQEFWLWRIQRCTFLTP